MSGSLVKLDEKNISSATATVSLGQNNWDSSYNVYKVFYNDLRTDSVSPNTVAVRFTKASDNSADTSTSYMYAGNTVKSYGATSLDVNNSIDRFYLSTLDTGDETQDNGIITLFQFNDSAEISQCTIQYISRNTRPGLAGHTGSAILNVNQATNGIQFFMNATGNIDNGHFVLYGLKK
tara:strand:- start:250 stop:783 length:534 start_codon:yes stop_codon:yes gene_type:complete